MRYFMIVMGIIITLTFVLAILAGSAQATAGARVSAGDAQPVDATPLIYLTLVGGAALLAGFVWLGTLRSTPRPIPNDCETEGLTQRSEEEAALKPIESVARRAARSQPSLG